MDSIKFVAAINRFFGRKPGQSAQEFAAEIRALTPKDREDLTPMLSEALGCSVENG